MTKFLKATILSFVMLLASFASISAQAPAAKTTPTFEIITPSENQTIYGNKVPILFNVENFEIVDYNVNKTPVASQGHIHIWLDDAAPTAESATKVIEDTYTFSDVPYTQHTLTAELVGNTHQSLTPPQKLTVTFNSEQIASAQNPDQYSGFDKKTALVILVVVALVIVAAWWYTKDEDEEETKTVKSSRAKKRKR